MKASQFEKIIPILNEITITKIGEIGTHRARSAIQFCQLALTQHNMNVHYTGYDIFDLLTKDESHKTEFNGKSIGDEQMSVDRLTAVSNKYNNRLTFTLHKGFTKETLTEPVVFDFVYIDGGHSYESVIHDWNMVNKSKLIIFDDWQKLSVQKALNEVSKTHNVVYYDKESYGRCSAIVRNI